MPQSVYGAKLTRVSCSELLLSPAHSIKPSTKRSAVRRFVSCATATCHVIDLALFETEP